MFKKLLSVAVLCLISAGAVFAQTGSLTGKVTDAKTGDSVPGANVLLVEISKGAATNTNGQYTINNIPVGTYTLRVSFVGYTTYKKQVQITAGQTLTQNINLEASSVGLEEVVVTGYGNVEKRSFTGSVSQVQSKDLEDVPVASVDQALQGNVAGATITASTGTPGAVQQIRIRGISSINAGTSPLFVIDGVPVVSGTNASSTATSSLGILSSLSPSDIESITVLKDAASTARYGARGSNGVIVIKTKSGQSGGVTYSVSAQRGFNKRAVDGPGAMNAKQWDQLYYDSGINAFGSKSTVDAIFGPSGYQQGQSTNWGDVVTNDNAVSQEYSLSARGGNEQTTFYTSGNFFQQDGQTIGSKLDRISGKLNLSHKLDERVTIKNNFTGSYVKQDGILEGAGYFGSPVLAEFFMKPTDPAFNADGTPNINNLSTNIFNPVYIQNHDIDRKRDYRLLNNTNIDIRLMDNLTFTTNFAIDYLFTEEKYYDNPFYGDGADVRGDVDDINNRNFNYVWKNTLEYVWSLNEDNVFNFKAVSESQRNYHNYLESYGEGIAAGGLYNNNTTATPQFVGSSTTDWADQSFTGLVSYGYKDKIYVDGSIRYEGNSRFSSSKRWGLFYSLGVGYILTEDLLSNVSWLDLLKVRASYGKTGNASIGLNEYQTLVGFGGYNDQPDIQPSQLGNPDLTWEKANSYDLGIDFEIFDNIINGSVSVYRKNGYDQLFTVPLSFTTGHANQTQNSGKLYNEGLEVELNADIIRMNNFAWSLGGNYSTLKNEVTQLPTDMNGDPVEITTSTRYRAVEGYPVDSWYMREWAGVDPQNGDPLWYMDDGNGGRTTTNNYNQADKYYQGGNTQPTQFGGINTRVDVYGFYVSAKLYYAFGNKVYDSWAYYLRSDGAYSFAFGQYASQSNYWQQAGDNALNPKPVMYYGNKNSNETSSRFLYDGDYLRLRTLNIGYNVPTRFLESFGLKSATVYFLGQNLWTHTFDKNLKYDPEVKQSGFLDLQAAPLKSITFGIKANF